MGLFDIIGPVMIGPSSSHTAGAARIGLAARRILGEPVKKAKITLYGSFAKTGRGHGTDRALVAGLMGCTPDDTRIRNSIHLAEEQGISIQFAFSDEDMGHPNVAKIEETGITGKSVTVIGRSLGGGRILITSIDGYDVEITGEEYSFLTRHHDVPGIVADVTAVFAKEHINITTMRLFLRNKNDEAVMIIHTDRHISKALCEEIKNINSNIISTLSLDLI